MKTNLLAQNDDLVIENLKADVGKSVMNLSHSVTFPIDVDGAILPICCIETVPSDSFQISVECLLRQLSPLKVPLMTNLRLNTAFYYCDNRLAWKKWDRFMTGGRSGNELYDIPRVANLRVSKSENPDKFDLIDYTSVSSGNSANIELNNSLHTYFGISLNHNFVSYPSYEDMTDYSSELPVAFPFFGYQLICRDYYTNIDRLTQSIDNDHFSDFDYTFADWSYENLFPSDDDEIRLKDGVQMISGFQSGDDLIENVHGFILDKVRYHDVRPDYFTSSKKAPMRGDPPSLTSSVSTLKLPSGSELNFGSEALTLKGHVLQTWTDPMTGLPVSKLHTIGPMKSAGELTESNTKIRVNNSIYSAGQPYTYHEGEVRAPDNYTIGNDGKLTTQNDLSLSGQLTTDWTAADIRLLSQLTVWQELNMLHDPYYNDFLNAHFDGVRVGESAVEKPQYIGGTSQVISINEILQTSQSTETSYLGNQGATAMSLASNNVGSYYCNNYGYIIGVCYIIPDMLYKPAMPRGFSRRAKEDYYSPEFANLSMQATLNKEIFFSNDDDWNNAPWGYTGAFDELRSIPNRVAGDLLNPSYTDLSKWVLTREMANDNLPAMESKWLSLKDNVDKAAWNVPSMPAFMLQCANYIKAIRPMPKVAIPKAL